MARWVAVLVLVLAAAGCSSAPPAQAPDACKPVNADLDAVMTKADAAADPVAKDAQLRLAARIIVNHPSCYSAEDVAVSQEFLAKPAVTTAPALRF